MEAKLIARRTSKGHNQAHSAALLAELTASHDGDNLAHALEYNDFTPAGRGHAAVAKLAA